MEAAARLLNGLVLPTAGTVRVGEVDPSKDAKAARRQTGFIFSNPDVQIIMPTVLEDVAFSLRGSALKKAEVEAKVDEDFAKRIGIESLDKLKANGMTIVTPSAQLKADMKKVGDTMLGEWLAKAGDDGKALVDAFRKP